jgi:NAD(P)-dependent dehydrogenase (short-subunit alcohol dehydrogenase family)
MTGIKGKSALVTGATRGIGLAIARLFLDREARVFICARNSRDVQDAVRTLSEEHADRIQGVACDVRRYDQVRSMFAEVERLSGGLDVLVNNAGVGSHSYVEQMPAEEWQSTIETNLSGVFYCCHEAIPLMKNRGGGYVINIGSLAGKSAFPGAAAYCASKFGLIGFSEALMQEVRYDHIRVSYIMPGSVNTGFGGKAGQDPAAGWKLAPEDVARVVMNLLDMDPGALPSRVELRPSEPKK